MIMKNFKITIFAALMAAILSLTGFASTQKDVHEKSAARLLLILPAEYNTPDGAALSKDGNIILSIPNFNNDHLIQTGKIKKPSPSVLAKIDKNNQITTWYKFKEEDMHPETGRIGPMDAAFGPDGNLYLADMQIFWNGEHKSRLLRINMKDGKPVDMDVVVEGFIVANGVTWKEDTLFVSETILAHTPKTKEGEKKPALKSGVYAFTLAELQKGLIKLSPYSENSVDKHLIVQFKSSNRLGFGADGVTVDAGGNLYTSIVEDGVIYKTKLDSNNKAIKTTLFAKDKDMVSADGIVWNPADSNIYVADFLGNAAHAVDMQGNVTTLHKNGDTDGADGSLDQPCEVIIRENELIIVSMDMAWAVPSHLQVDREVDQPYTLSVIELENDTLEAKNKQLVLDFWRHFSLGDADGVVGLMTADATFTVVGRTGGFEGIGEKSRQDLVETLGWIKEVMPNGLVYSIKGMIAEGNKVAAEGESYGVTTKGKAYRGLYHFLFEIEKGKIKAVREYLETIHAQQILVDDFK
jgi:ketosteroid isomerase-like protein